MKISIIGAGVAGLCCACECLDRGHQVEVHERARVLGDGAASWFAGGMLAPRCEAESAPGEIVEPGLRAIDWWDAHINGLQRRGSLVLSPQRDRSELQRFARLTSGYRRVDRAQIAELEADLEGRFEQGLLFGDEAHLDPRQALQQLGEYVRQHGGQLHLGSSVQAEELKHTTVLDCRGYAARDQLPRLRGIKGEMLLIRSTELQLRRPIRLLHPRHPIYLVPRADGLYMLGATMLESSDGERISARSMLELLSAAYALHPALAEAEIVEIGVGLRPAFDDNLPALQRGTHALHVNGMYRHGFLLGPELAKRAIHALEG